MGVHESHCCVKHGCKYGQDDCPVETGVTKQEYTCETCSWHGIESLEQLDMARKGTPFKTLDLPFNVGDKVWATKDGISAVYGWRHKDSPIQEGRITGMTIDVFGGCVPQYVYYVHFLEEDETCDISMVYRTKEDAERNLKLILTEENDHD